MGHNSRISWGSLLAMSALPKDTQDALGELRHSLSPPYQPGYYIPLLLLIPYILVMHFMLLNHLGIIPLHALR